MELRPLTEHDNYSQKAKPNIVVIPDNTVDKVKRCVQGAPLYGMGLVWSISAGAAAYILRPYVSPYLTKVPIVRKIMVPTAAVFGFMASRIHMGRLCFHEVLSNSVSNWGELAKTRPYLLTMPQFQALPPSVVEKYNVYICNTDEDNLTERDNLAERDTLNTFGGEYKNVPGTAEFNEDRRMESYEEYSPFNDSSDFNRSVELDLTEEPTVNKNTTSYRELRAKNRAKYTETNKNTQEKRQPRELKPKPPPEHVNAYGDNME